MNKSKRVLALGSALVAIAMMAACAAPVPENGASKAVTPQDEGAQVPDNPSANAPQDGVPQGPPNAQGGGMGARGFMMDASTIEDPDKPAGDPAYSGMVVSIEGDQLTILVSAGMARQQPPADDNNRRDQDARANMEQKTLTLAAGFRAKKAEFERPDGNQDGNRDGRQAPGATKLTEITKEQLTKDDRITVWQDESGNAVYAIVMSGFGGNRGGPGPGQNERQGGDGPQRRGDGVQQ